MTGLDRLVVGFCAVVVCLMLGVAFAFGLGCLVNAFVASRLLGI